MVNWLAPPVGPLRVKIYFDFAVKVDAVSPISPIRRPLDFYQCHGRTH